MNKYNKPCDSSDNPPPFKHKFSLGQRVTIVRSAYVGENRLGPSYHGKTGTVISLHLKPEYSSDYSVAIDNSIGIYPGKMRKVHANECEIEALKDLRALAHQTPTGAIVWFETPVPNTGYYTRRPDLDMTVKR